MANKKIYFPGLNGVRAIAAMAVIIGHIEGFKDKAELSNLHHLSIFSNLGSQGVKIFFVLSGFLITYLLLSERQVTNTIAVKKFYIRRILRIWPLYFLIVFLGFFVLPYFLDPDYFTTKTTPDFFTKLVLMIFLLPNLALYTYGSIFSQGVLWSIGAEEQFYLIWPNIVKRAKKSIDKVLFMMIGIILLIKGVCWGILFSPDIFSQTALRIAKIVEKIFVFDCMMIGGLFAYVYFTKHKLLDFLYKKPVQIAAILIILIYMNIKVNLYLFSNIFVSVLYGTLILNIATNKQTLLKLTNKPIDFIGKISYGMYMYHSIMIVLFILILEPFEANLPLYNVLLHTAVMLSTVIIAYLSYNGFEKPLLKYKKRFMVVESGKI